jgi:hypothetical protein
MENRERMAGRERGGEVKRKREKKKLERAGEKREDDTFPTDRVTLGPLLPSPLQTSDSIRVSFSI